MFYFLNLYSYREYSRKKTNGFNFFNFFNFFNSKKLSECETWIRYSRSGIKINEFILYSARLIVPLSPILKKKGRL